MRTLIIAFIILALLIAYAVTGAQTYSAPASSRATYTPAPERTQAPLATPMPTPTDIPSAYPAPDTPRTSQEAPGATEVPRRGLRCGNC